MLEARIPIELTSLDDYYSQKLKDYVIMTLYYSFVLLILVFNIIPFINFKNKAYLHYMFIAFGMAANVFYKDGLVAFFLGSNSANEYIEPFINLIVPFAAVFFVRSYLDLENKLNTLWLTGIAMLILSFISAVVFKHTRDLHWLIVTHGLELLTIDLFWLYGVILWKDSIYVRLYAIAYGVPLLIAHDFYFSPYFGFSLFNTSPTLYKLGSLFEMTLFTYAIMYFTKGLAIKNKEYRLKIEEYTQELNRYSTNKTGLEVEENLVSVYGFTVAEMNILKLISEKYKNKDIAEKSFVSENTVKFHIKNIYTKLNVKNRADAKSFYDNLK